MRVLILKFILFIYFCHPQLEREIEKEYKAKLILRCVNWFGTEFLWVPSVKTKLSKQSVFKAIDRGLDGNWIKAKWKSNSVGWQSWSHPGTDRIPEWSKMDDAEIVDMVFDGRIIETLDHEALIRNVGGNV